MLFPKGQANYRIDVRNGNVTPAVSPNDGPFSQPVYDGETRIVFEESLIRDYFMNNFRWRYIRRTVEKTAPLNENASYMIRTTSNRRFVYRVEMFPIVSK